MRAEHINPFIESVSEVFESMLETDVEALEIQAAKDDKGPPDIIALIGLSGTAQGVVALKFPVQTALGIISKMVGFEIHSVDSSVIDGVGELVNIVAGNAKTKFTKHSIRLSLPSVVRGNLYTLKNLGELTWLSVPFKSNLGDFEIEVSFKPATKKAVKKDGGKKAANPA
ncbi:MAG: chemotaxis protein CheX [candidate division Zixibacteria bacterium]|nr:chemotaxis protein CheX [candidate division Zixibacteria bacterium]